MLRICQDYKIQRGEREDTINEEKLIFGFYYLVEGKGCCCILNGSDWMHVYRHIYDGDGFNNKSNVEEYDIVSFPPSCSFSFVQIYMSCKLLAQNLYIQV
jgi:hypothetical protein